MNTTLFDRRRAERFAQLVDEANGGRKHHTRSRLDDRLDELVTVGQQLGALPISVAPEAVFKRDLRAMLMATAEREGIGVTAVEPETVRVTPISHPARPPRQARARGAIVVGIVTSTLALSGVSVASGEAMPGDALYGIKRSTEKAQLALAGSDLGRGQLYLGFARTRLQEAYSVRAAAGGGFATAMNDMDSDTELGVRLLTAAAAQRRDTGALDIVDRFAADQRMLVAQLLNVVSDENRIEVTASLTLLDAVEKQSRELRIGLACNAEAAGDDALGPKTAACSAASPNSLGG